MTGWLARAARARPTAVALIQGATSLDYATLASRAAQRASRLARMGIRPGDRVVVPVRRSLDVAIWLHALLWLEAPFVPVSRSLPPERVRALFDGLRPRALIATDSRWLSAARAGYLPDADGFVIDATRAAAAEPEARPATDGDPDRIATILLTSGSSAAPKAVPLTFAQHAASTGAIASRSASTAADCWLLCLPLDHVGGLAILIRSVILGSSAVLLERFEPLQFARVIARRHVTLTSLVPGMLDDLLRSKAQPPGSLRGVFVGGARISPSLLSRARSAGWPVIPTWGMTEACSQLATPAPAEAAAMPFDDDGTPRLPPLPGVDVRVAPSGRLQVRGPMLFTGYLGHIAPGPDAEGWFTTGDRGTVEPNGAIRVLGRADDVIISGGLNVHLESVARRLLECPLIADAAAIGIDDSRWGQRVAAVVVPRDPPDRGEDLVEALERWARGRLAPEERPSRWRVVERIPRSTVGKPMRTALTALFE